MSCGERSFGQVEFTKEQKGAFLDQQLPKVTIADVIGIRKASLSQIEGELIQRGIFKPFT